MLAMVVRATGTTGSGVLRPEYLPLPTVAPDGVLVRVLACGVCHTDLHICRGELPAPSLPLIPGHEVVGMVEAMGPEVPRDLGLAPGTRVGVAWLHRTCGVCRFCRSGRENLCVHAAFTGYDVPGGYAEYLTAPADFVYQLPSSFDDTTAAPLLCAGIIGWRAVRRAGVQAGERVGLFGFGASAHLTLQVLSAWGCQVAVWSRGARHQALAMRLGAVWAGAYDQVGPWPLERAIVFTPAGETVLEALSRLDRGGVVAIASVHTSPIPSLDHNRLLFGEREIRSVTASTRGDGEAFLRIAEQLRLKVAVVPFPLRRAEDALGALARGEIDGAAVLLPDGA
jgi:propanol-preferring alcohol dehydrogenase